MIFPPAAYTCTRRSRGTIAVLWLVLLAIPALASAATYPLEIIAPREGANPANRYSKAYPGLIYEVDIATIGGLYPYQHTLNAGPAGMAIDSNTGRISWPNPVAAGSPHSVSVSVRDASGKTTSVTWTITVTTAGFRFIDAINGRTAAQGGDGTRQNPWRSPADFYRTKHDATYRGEFIYWRSGTYRIADAPIEDRTRMALTGNNKPQVWLAYPGESPIIDTTNSHVAIYQGGSNSYFDGLTFQNFNTGFGVRIDSNADNVIFRENLFRNLQAGWGGTGTNASAVMIANGGAVGRYWGFLNNRFEDIHDVAYGILSYRTDRVLVQGNAFRNFTVASSKAIGPKNGNSMWFIRDNRINISAGQGIWIDTYSTGSDITRDIEISYNLVLVRTGHALWVGQEPARYGEVTSLRNTYSGARVVVDNLTSTSGPVSFDSDVIINDTSSPNRITTSGSVLTRNLLIGSISDNIVDASGKLSGDYRQYLGSRGYERNGQSASRASEPPQDLSVR